MKLYPYLYSAIASLLLTACTLQDAQKLPQLDSNQVSQKQLKVVNLDKTKILMGQTIYVPVYSHIYFENKKQAIDLSATLSVRNTDIDNSIIITSVRYYDTNGKLVRQYLENPVELGSLASTDFVVERTDKSGGLGANFIVEWVAEKEVSQPVVETVMISASSAQGISFVSNGRVIKNVSQKK